MSDHQTAQLLIGGKREPSGPYQFRCTGCDKYFPDTEKKWDVDGHHIGCKPKPLPEPTILQVREVFIDDEKTGK